MSGNIITIDGPSGAGKSTIARLVALRLGLRYLDTGAMYRALTLHCMLAGTHLDNPKEIAEAIKSADLSVELSLHGPMRVALGDNDVTEKIRTQEVTRNIHYVADVMEVRNYLVEMQRKIGEAGNLVTEGRDQGTFVFPNASLKVYNVAGAEVATLVNGLVGAGAQSVVFDASNLTSGVYFYALEVAGTVQTRKMVLAK